jgi:hypothetical protein
VDGEVHLWVANVIQQAKRLRAGGEHIRVSVSFLLLQRSD